MVMVMVLEYTFVGLPSLSFVSGSSGRQTRTVYFPGLSNLKTLLRHIVFVLLSPGSSSHCI